jgi:hypothetical protein
MYHCHKVLDLIYHYQILSNSVEQFCILKLQTNMISCYAFILYILGKGSVMEIMTLHECKHLLICEGENFRCNITLPSLAQLTQESSFSTTSV